MNKSVKRTSGILAAIVAAGALSAGTGSAVAASTTVSPAGNTISLAASPVKTGLYQAMGVESCTISGGAAQIPAAPANTNPTGPVTINLTTRPTFSNCSVYGGAAPITVTTSGTWSLKFQNGATKVATLTIPANGLRANFSSGAGCSAYNYSAIVLNGTWTNGSSTPFTASTLAGGFSYQTANCSGTGWTTTFAAPSWTTSNLTNPTAPILIGS